MHHHHHHSHVLQLDIQGTPQAWVSLEQAAVRVAVGSVAWVDGDGPLATLRGGFNVASGRQSLIDVHPIMALHGAPRVNLFDVRPAFGKGKLFRRDRMTCAYCGQRFAERDLQCEHIVPESRGGPWSWMNLVTACGPCNGRKACRTPEEAGMPLMYLPYVPSRFEDFLLEGRHIRGDVHEWLAARLPKDRACTDAGININRAVGRMSGERANKQSIGRAPPEGKENNMKNELLPPVEIKVKQPPVLFSKTQALIDRLAQALGGPLVAYWNGPRGSVCHSDVVALHHVLDRLGHHEVIYLFLKSDGGSGQVSLRLVNLLRQHCRRLVALVPLECASAATMIALGADGIQMGPTAYLTAVDTSLNHALSPVDRDNDRVSVSLNELQRVIRLWREQQGGSPENAYKSLFQYVHPLVIGAVDRAESLSIMLCRELLAYHVADEAQAEAISTALNGKYPSHSYPILLDEAVKIGLRAERMPAAINSLLLQLNACYSEMGQKATTDFDETHAHSNEISNIWESTAVQVYYQHDKNWFYRAEERRWITMNDNSGWRRIERVGKRIQRGALHVA